MEISPEMKKQLLRFQQDEIDGHNIYEGLSKQVKNAHNSEVIAKMARDEMFHYQVWQRYSGEDVKPNKTKKFFYLLASRLFGYTFGIKLLEKDENNASVGYEPYKAIYPELDQIIRDEDAHEAKLIEMLDEESLKYSGSVVLGLNDALVELTGGMRSPNTALIAAVSTRSFIGVDVP